MHKYSKIKGLTWDEASTRLRQAFAKRQDLFAFKLGWRFQGDRIRQTGAEANFFFQPEQIPAIIATVRKELPETAAAIQNYADSICAHRFDLLGYQQLEYGEKIDWHLDAVNQRRAPRKSWYRIAYLDFDTVGDSKIIWELNRHQHLVTLAKAFHLTGNGKYLGELLAQWYDWRENNPYPIGINWASSLEVALRSISWLWIWELLRGCESIPQNFHRDLQRELALAGRHIELFLSTYFAPNTHLLGEGLALFFIGTLAPALSKASHWQALLKALP